MFLRWRAAAALIAEHRDVLEGRPDEGATPAALVARGWAPYLLALDDVALDQLEAGGLAAAWPGEAPASLVALTAALREVCDVPRAPEAAPSTARRHETPRKRAQVDAFAAAVLPLARGRARIVDVGSGHGHLTRSLAERLGSPVLGLERDPALAERARQLAGAGAVSFAVADVLAGGLALAASDCVVGLHACGELGDAMVESAARAGAAIALVGCCLQKRRAAARTPLHAPDEALVLPKAILGLSNLTTRDDAVETSRVVNVRARERRLALHRLLAEAGEDLPLGAEIEGLNRRAAQADLALLVARAYDRRGLALPSPLAIARAARWAAEQHARIRRLALPRSLMARALEVYVVLDRAVYLETRGYDVTVAQLFPPEVSARNLVVSAMR